MRKPYLTAAVIRGLQEFIPVLDAGLTAPSDSEFQSCTPAQLADAATALDYISKLTVWYQQNKGAVDAT